MGGGAMRTAAKAAVLAGYRSNAARRAPIIPPAAAAKAAAASTLHVEIEGESAQLVSSISSERSAGAPAVIQRPAWEIDEWEFAGGKEEEAVLDRMLDPPPRLVFGTAPTLEEAKEATADLKEAIEKAYFSSGTTDDSVKVSQVSDHGKSATILPSMPKHVVQAFSLLQGSPEAQTVVASLACDENVWDAVMKNDKVMEFCNKYQSILSPETNVAPEESTGENEIIEEFSETVDLPGKETSEGSAFFTDMVQNIKVKVSEMVSNISGFLQDFMVAPSENQGTTNTKTSTSTSDNYVDLALGATFIALAVAAILVILVKRG